VGREADYFLWEGEKGPILLGGSTSNLHHWPTREGFQRGEGYTIQQTSLVCPRNICQDAIAVLVGAIEAHDPSIYGHPRRVVHLAQAIGWALGWEEERVSTIEIGALLHDLGKIVISDTILKKPGPLTEAEYNEVKRHPEAGAQLLIAGGPFLEAAMPYALYHHERYDGGGYPYGLAGEEIPIEGRILAVADAFEAMTSDRPYRKRMEPELALEIIERSAGSHFDPKVAATFLKAWELGYIQALLERNRSEKQTLPLKMEDMGIGIPTGELSAL